MLDVQALTAERLPDLGELFASDLSAEHCWCMWFIIPVREFHAPAPDLNRDRFRTLVQESSEPLGLIAYAEGTPVGWCAAGPKARFVRAVRTPTLLGDTSSDDRLTWLVPCFFVHPAKRRSGVSRLLLQHAITHAKQHNARAIEGFPFSSAARGSGGDRQVVRESVFASCGFTPVRRPSDQRVVMRLELS